MRKKIIAVFLTVVILLTGLVVMVNATMPSITVSSVQANRGDVISLSVILENNPGINTFSLGFDYDKANLILENVTVNEDLGGQFVYVDKAVWLDSKDVDFNGEILTLEFKVRHTAKEEKTDVSVTYQPGDISNYDEKNVNFKIVPGTVTIGEEEVAQPSFWQRILSFFKWIYDGIKNLFSFI